MNVKESDVESLVMYCMTDFCPYNLQPEIFMGKLNIPEADYIRLTHLGDGSYSTVYEVKRIGAGKNDRFAQKVIRRIVQKEDLDILVYREITILRNLDHENVIKLCDILVGGEQRSLSLIMEYCDTDLEKFINYYPMQEITKDQVKCIAIHLLRGLNYLHKNYLVHRDIKPSNLLIKFDGDSNGILKIADFGLARKWNHLNKPSTPGRMTLQYQAPEILFGAPEYDSKVDMWSAGCVIIEVMTRKPLFEECRREMILVRRMTEILGTPRTSVWPGYSKCKFRNWRFVGAPYNKLSDTLSSLGCTVAETLLHGLIMYDPERRFSAEKCLDLDFFQQAPMPSKRIEKPEILPYHRPSSRAINKF